MTNPLLSETTSLYSLLFAYTQKKFLENYATTVFDNWAINVTIERKSYTVNLFDTAGQVGTSSFYAGSHRMGSTFD